MRGLRVCAKANPMPSRSSVPALKLSTTISARSHEIGEHIAAFRVFQIKRDAYLPRRRFSAETDTSSSLLRLSDTPSAPKYGGFCRHGLRCIRVFDLDNAST
jgi:hypothetical protein